MDKIICVGKNYLDHVKEMGGPVPERPVLFFKPPSCLLQVAEGETIAVPLPTDRGSVHFECEIVVRLKRGGYQMTLKEATEAIGEFTLGLDLTLREVQAEVKKQGGPWEIAKCFPNAAIVGPWIAETEHDAYLREPFSFSLEGKIRQQARAAEMRLSLAECIKYASESFEICEGDLLFSGTPAGVGELQAGQTGTLAWREFQYSVSWR